VSRRNSTISPEAMGDRNIEIAARPSKGRSIDTNNDRALSILGGIYEAEVHELEAAARTVRRIAPADADVILDALGLLEAS
jgi:hypothetical protein